MAQLTERQAFETMVRFLEGIYERTQSDDIGALLSDLLISEANETADPAAWEDWMNSVQTVLLIKADKS
jgi:hypothetical protein